MDKAMPSDKNVSISQTSFKEPKVEDDHYHPQRLRKRFFWLII